MAYKEEEERRLQAEHARKQRALEAEKLASNQTSTARSFFKRKESQTDDEPVHHAPAPPRYCISGIIENVLHMKMDSAVSMNKF